MSLRCAGALGAAIVLLSGAARGAKPAGVEIAGPDSSCPTREEVLDALVRLGTPTDPDRISTVGARGGPGHLRSRRSPAVEVAGRVREYLDSDRDCARRARLAAVFVTLILAPQRAGGPANELPAARVPATSLPPPPPSSVLAVAPDGPPRQPAAPLAVDLGPTVAVAPHQAGAFIDAGLELALRRRFRVVDVGVAITAPVLCQKPRERSGQGIADLAADRTA